MLYGEFLEGTKAVDNKASYEEYKRVEEIYMESTRMSKEDAYRMAKVVTVEDYEKQMKKDRKIEKAWVLENIIPAASFIRAASEAKSLSRNYFFVSPCGNEYELKLVKEINGGSVTLYELRINKELIDTRSTGYGLIPGAEIGSYRSRWIGKSKAELEELFGFISWEE